MKSLDRRDLQPVTPTAKVVPTPKEETFAAETASGESTSLHNAWENKHEEMLRGTLCEVHPKVRDSKSPTGPKSTALCKNGTLATIKCVANERVTKPWALDECIFEHAQKDILKNQSWLQRMTRSQRYEWASGALILCNAVFIGAQTELAAQRAQDFGLEGEQAPDIEPAVIVFGSAVFTFLFAIELLARWISEGLLGLFRTVDFSWCIFDVFIVLLSIVDSFVEVAVWIQQDPRDSSILSSISLLRVLRVMRVVKLVRVIKLMTFFRELRLMIYSILGSLKTLVWVTMVLGMTFYIFGIMFTAGTVTYVDSVWLWTDPASEGLRYNFATMGGSFLALYMAMTGGRSWGEYYSFLADIPVQYRLLFLTFLTFTIYAVLNVVTAVFVDSAMQAGVKSREVMIHEEMDSNKRFWKDLRNLFHEMDEDGEGTLTADELSQHLSDERVVAYLKALKLDVTDTVSLFQLLDSDDSKEVDVVEFLEGCYQLQGETRSIDTKILRLQVQWIVNAFEVLQHEIRTASAAPKSSSWPPELA